MEEYKIHDNFSEIERKWLLKTIPDMVLEGSRSEVVTYYLSVEPEVRIRKRMLEGSNEYEYFLLDIKSNGTISRDEVTIKLNEAQFDQLAKMVGKDAIIKDYYLLDLPEGYQLELTVVDPGTDAEFIYCEVEFEEEAEAARFILPFEGEEVTSNPYWKMKNYWKRTRLGE